METQYMYIIGVILLLIIIVAMFSCRCSEAFKSFVRKPVSKKKVQLGIVKDTPGPLKELITQLQKLGGQLQQDTKYDKVATNYLDPKKIK